MIKISKCKDRRLRTVLLISGVILSIISCRTQPAPVISQSSEINSQKAAIPPDKRIIPSPRKKESPIPLPSSLSQAAAKQLSRNEPQENERKQRIIDLIHSMSIREKIGQLFFLAYRKTRDGAPLISLSNTLKAYLNTYNPGGMILFSVNFKTPEQTRKLINDIQSISTIPLFIATDEEGGKVSRLSSNPEMNVAHLPSAAILRKRENPASVQQKFSKLADQMKDLGINVDMAPVADVSRHTSPDIIGNRSFSKDPAVAGEYVTAVVQGLHEHNVASVLKHFPGHGNVTGDTHSGWAAARGSKKEFEQIDFIPFIKGISAHADFIMTAHIAAPSLTGNNNPSSLSRVIQTRILRNTLHFKGIIITDSLEMGAIKSIFDPGEAALRAFTAGADMLLIPANTAAAQEALETALQNGTISEKRLTESLIRILSLKMEMGMFAKK